MARLRPAGFGAAALLASRAKSGGCSRTRTCDPLIKSQLLYQLSYAPARERFYIKARAACRAGSLALAAEAADARVAVNIDAHQEAEAEHHRQHRRAAIGNERQGHAHHRDQSHHHRRIDEDVEEEV